MQKQIRILILEDNISYAELIQRTLRKSDLNFTSELAQNKSGFLKALDTFLPDIILADYKLPDLDGLSALKLAQDRLPEILFIIVSGVIGEDTAIEALKAGATDYVLKNGLKRLMPIIKRALNEAEVLTKQRRAQQALESERANLQKIFDVVNIGMLLIDEHGIVKRMNNVMAKWVQDTAIIRDRAQIGDVIGCIHAMGESMGCGHTDHCSSCQIRKAVLYGGKPIHNVEIEAVLSMNGNLVYRWLDISADPIFVEEKIYTLFSINDITQRKRAEEILKRDNQMLEGLVSEKTQEVMVAREEMERGKRLSDIGTLAATVAHELRNPLAAIGMAAHNIKRKNTNPNLDKHLANIDKKVSESDQIINNLLFYSRLKSPQFEKVDMLGLLEESVETAQAKRPKEISLIRNTDSLKGVFLEADPVQMKEVFINILNNAYDALPPYNGEIRITSKVDDGYITISVEDNGPGIAKNVLHKIFDPFFTTKAKGTGLGLSVCKQIMSMHSGEIGVKNGASKGTCIVVRLPKKEITSDHETNPNP